MPAASPPTKADPSPQSWYRWPPLSYVVTAAVAILLAALLIGILRQVGEVFFLFFLSLIFAVLLDVPVSFLSRWMPRGLATVLVVFLALGLIGFGASVGLAKIIDQLNNLADQLPVASRRLQDWWDHLRAHGGPVGQVAQEAQDQAQSAQAGGGELAKIAGAIVPVAFGTVHALAAGFVLIVLSAFLAYDPKTYVDGLLALVPEKHVDSVRTWLGRTGLSLRGWLTGTLAAMVSMGILVSVGLAILGVKAWLILGIVMFLCEFVPFLGPVVGAVPGIAVGLTVSFHTGLETLALYVVLQQIEGNVLQPYFMRRAVKLRPALLVLWQVLIGAAFGVPGLVIATPLLACVKVAVEHFYVERTLGKVELEPAGAGSF